MILYLDRIASFEFGVFGRITLPNKTLYTVEREWNNNQKSISCIPNGEYKCRLAYFNRGKYQTFEVTNVPDRSNILFHIANFSHELNGCIGLGEEIGVIWTAKGPKLGIKHSRRAFEYFYHYMLSLTPFELIIRTSEEDFAIDYWEYD